MSPRSQPAPGPRQWTHQGTKELRQQAERHDRNNGSRVIPRFVVECCVPCAMRILLRTCASGWEHTRRAEATEYSFRCKPFASRAWKRFLMIFRTRLLSSFRGSSSLPRFALHALRRSHPHSRAGHAGETSRLRSSRSRAGALGRVYAAPFPCAAAPAPLLLGSYVLGKLMELDETGV